MKLIAITLPVFFAEEAELINLLFKSGLPLLHLRKLDASVDEVERLIKSIDASFYNKIALHAHFSLVKKYHLGGVHLNHRSPLAPDGWTGSVSCSCHSLEEARQANKDKDYYFLSPIYDSVSKSGYLSDFTTEQLREEKHDNIITRKTIALGGVTTANISQIRALQFGGCAVLGSLWKNKDNVKIFQKNFLQLLNACDDERQYE